MELIRHLPDRSVNQSGCVVTIGNFDGVHLGHQAVIQQVKQIADEMDLPSAIMTFEPQPLEYFAPETAPARLTSFREKCALLDECMVDRVYCLRFTRQLAELAATEFISELLVAGMGMKCLVIGDDFRFGRGREGDINMLQEMGKDNDYQVVRIDTFTRDSERVSSSRIRKALAAGIFDEAELLLGRPYSIIGRVIRGEQRGRKLGFPTANIVMGKRTAPLLGVYIVRVHGLHNRVYDAVANVGTRPVFNGEGVVLESHLLDFNEEIYSSLIRVEFVKWLRAEHKFESVNALSDQIKKDIEDAREHFALEKKLRKN